MLKEIKYKKIAVVIFLTLLIWVWADLALDERLPIYNTRISISKSIDPGIWVSFDNEQFVVVGEFILKGPVSKISYARRAKEEGTLNFDFTFDAEQANLIGQGLYTVNTLDFLRESYQIKRLGLIVESCDPPTFTVNVEKLVRKSMPVQCVDTSGISLNAQGIEPSEVDMYVPDDYGRESAALVRLNEADVRQARTAGIEKFPFIELPDGQVRLASESVKIKMLPVEDPRGSYKITNAKIGYCMSHTTQGKYKVDVTNLTGILSSIAVRATSQAKDAYENMTYHVLLEITDADINAQEQIVRDVIYNFPKRYEKNNEIILDQPPAKAQFKLEPLPSANNP